MILIYNNKKYIEGIPYTFCEYLNKLQYLWDRTIDYE